MMYLMLPTLFCEHTYACENFTFPQVRLPVVITHISKFGYLINRNIVSRNEYKAVSLKIKNSYRTTSLFLPTATNLGQGNIFRSVCQEFCSQGGLPHCMLGYTHWTRGRHPAMSRHPPQEQIPQDQRQAPPGTVHAGRYGQQVSGMHFTGMQSCSPFNIYRLQMKFGAR